MAKKKGAAVSEVPPAQESAEKVDFFHDLNPVRAFIHMRAPRRDAKKKRQLVITFRMALNGNLVRSAPDFIQTAYDGVKDHEEKSVALKREIENVTIAIFETDKSKNSSEELGSVRLEKLCVSEISSSKGDPSIVLTFQTVYPWDSSIWRFLGGHYGADVFLQFDATQATLLDLVDRFERGNDAKSKAANDDSQAELPGVTQGATEDESEGAEA